MIKSQVYCFCLRHTVYCGQTQLEKPLFEIPIRDILWESCVAWLGLAEVFGLWMLSGYNCAVIVAVTRLVQCWSRLLLRWSSVSLSQYSPYKSA